MAENPYMPWHWQAYFADTRHLTCLEHGAYTQILGQMWLNGGVLPNDDAFLMCITKTDKRQWQRMKAKIMAFMRQLEGNNFTQNNLLDKLRVVKFKREKAVASINARWLKTKGMPDTNVLRTKYERYTIKNSKIESFLVVQSPTPAREESGSAEKKGPEASPATIEVTPALLNTLLIRKR